MRFFYLCLFVIAFSRSTTAQTPPNYTFPIAAKDVAHLAWTKEKWQGDDKPYYALRMQITAALKAGKASDALIAHYKTEYERNPTDPLKLFAWACAVILPRIVLFQSTDLQGIQEAFAKSKPPHTYEFMRIRYLNVEQQHAINDYTTALRNVSSILRQKDDIFLMYFRISLRWLRFDPIDTHLLMQRQYFWRTLGETPRLSGIRSL